MANKKDKCVRCEALERPQRSKVVHKVLGVPICSVCIEELVEETFFFKDLEEDESGSEEID